MSGKPGYKFSICRTIATGGIVFLVVFAISAGGNPLMFLNIPAMAFVFGICFFLLLGAYGADFLKFIPASLISLVCSPSRPSRRYAEIAKFGSRYVIAGGVITSLLGVIAMMGNLSDPSHIGMGIAMSMLPPFYAILASEIFFAFVYQAFSDSKSDSDTPKHDKPQLPATNLLIPIIVSGFMIGMFFLLLQTFSFSPSWGPVY